MKSIFCVMALSLALLPLAGCETLTDTPLRERQPP